MATLKLERLIQREEELELEIEQRLKDSLTDMTAEEPAKILALARYLMSRGGRLKKIQTMVDRQKDLEGEA